MPREKKINEDAMRDMLLWRKKKLALQKIANEMPGPNSVRAIGRKHKVKYQTLYEHFRSFFGYPFNMDFILEIEIREPRSGATDPIVREAMDILKKRGYDITKIDKNLQKP